MIARCCCVEPARPALAVLYVDLDGLNAINDRHGHHSGDELGYAFFGEPAERRVIRLATTLAAPTSAPTTNSSASAMQ